MGMQTSTYFHQYTKWTEFNINKFKSGITHLWIFPLTQVKKEHGFSVLLIFQDRMH